MSSFQLLSAHINLGGSRDHVVVRGTDNPITFPEMQVLRVIHGGEEHVHSEHVIGTVERSNAEERQRLVETYGPDAVNALFPSSAFPLPEGDPAIPTAEEVAKIKAAAEGAKAAAFAQRAGEPVVPPPSDPDKASQKSAKKDPASEPAVPDLVG